MNIAVIPARGGSKRIPKKNIREFAGKPLIVYSIETAQQSGVFDHIVVSTDDREIADTARRYGATDIIMRPPELADDFTGTTPVVRHALRVMVEQGARPDFVCCIYATAPMLKARYLQQGLDALRRHPNKQYAFSVTSFAFPIQRAIRIVGQEDAPGVEPVNPEMMGKRSQDLEDCYHDAGQFYWGRADAFARPEGVFQHHSIPVILPRHLVQDIDTEEDWVRAELMYKAQKEHDETR
ncbi:pseudaminic acid cytidylyltransferase [Alteromonas sp. CYL-A6]|uniref:pseudaminic acid cytidylyltransferase n=1 Tax=Alteromonas nitratireducens TaxID=3390813 RepID=UPI0034B8451A